MDIGLTTCKSIQGGKVATSEFATTTTTTTKKVSIFSAISTLVEFD
jgi:hypothetical protein